MYYPLTKNAFDTGIAKLGTSPYLRSLLLILGRLGPRRVLRGRHLAPAERPRLQVHAHALREDVRQLHHPRLSFRRFWHVLHHKIEIVLTNVLLAVPKRFIRVSSLLYDREFEG